MRESLREGPKALIPPDMLDIDEENFDPHPTRDMAARKQKLRSLGALPKNGNDANELKAQVVGIP